MPPSPPRSAAALLYPFLAQSYSRSLQATSASLHRKTAFNTLTETLLQELEHLSKAVHQEMARLEEKTEERLGCEFWLTHYFGFAFSELSAGFFPEIREVGCSLRL